MVVSSLSGTCFNFVVHVKMKIKVYVLQTADPNLKGATDSTQP